MRKTLILTIFLVLSSFVAAISEVPDKISYQGVLQDALGNNLTGAFTVTFRLFDAEDQGTLGWQETQDITCDNGVFNVLLGTNVAFDTLSFQIPYWLELQVGTNNPLPRVLLTTAAYSMTSKKSLDNQWGISTVGDIFTLNSGNVGIGTSNPSTALEVNGNITASNIYAYSGISTSDVFVDGNITAGGKIGIGTDLPEETLDVRGGIRLGNTDQTASGTIRWTGTDFEGRVGNSWESLTLGNLWKINGNNIYSSNTGNVGIGTDNPASKLHIVGNVLISGDVNTFGAFSTTNLLTDSNVVAMGNIGVRTGTPTSTLDINGSKAWKVTEVNSNTTLNDTNNVVLVNNTTLTTISLPPAANCTGRVYTIKRIGSSTVLIDPYSSETIDGSITYTLSSTYQKVTIVSNGINWYIIEN
jgi:hypothetical protein